MRRNLMKALSTGFTLGYLIRCGIHSNERMGQTKRNLMKVVALEFAISLILAVMVYGQDLKQMLQQRVEAARAESSWDVK